MSLVEKIHQDMVGAMKQRAVERLSTLRMVVSALKNKEIEQRTPVTDPQALQVLTTLIKQRKDSIEQFTKGNRPELAEKEAAEIKVIEEYMPKAAGDDELRQLVSSTLAELRAQGAQLGPKDMGTVMKAVQVKIEASGARADGRVVSELVKAKLAGHVSGDFVLQSEDIGDFAVVTHGWMTDQNSVVDSPGRRYFGRYRSTLSR